MEAYVKPPVEVAGSLATQMNLRAEEQERARKQRAEQEAEQKKRRDAEYAEKLNEQIREDAYRQQAERERLQQQARKRAMSDATEVPAIEDSTPIETFEREIKWRGHSFFKVRLFHPRQGSHHAEKLFHSHVTDAYQSVWGRSIRQNLSSMNRVSVCRSRCCLSRFSRSTTLPTKVTAFGVLPYSELTDFRRQEA